MVNFKLLEQAPAKDIWVAWRMQFAPLIIHLKIDGMEDVVVRTGPSCIVVCEDQGGPADLTFISDIKAWENFASAHPDVGYQSLASMLERDHLNVQGDILLFSRHAMMLEKLFVQLRPIKETKLPDYNEPKIEETAGRYIRMNMNGQPVRVYFEEAGSGVPLLCLHTAGSDNRQYRALMNDPEITSRFRVIAFDLPWHGKSAPPPGFQNQPYLLSTDSYMTNVMDFCRALKLERPVVMGCSIGGRAVLHLALRHGEAFRAGIGLQSATHAENHISAKYDMTDQHVLHRPDMNGGDVAAASVMAIMSPVSPPQHEWETLWYYMQGGPGVFLGDLNYYFFDGDMRNGLIDGIDPEICPLYFLTGEYDLSATPEMTQALAKAVNARHCETMEGVGHFPMSEDPEKFRNYLLPVLDKILTETC